jgi:hypothetical protein
MSTETKRHMVRLSSDSCIKITEISNKFFAGITNHTKMCELSINLLHDLLTHTSVKLDYSVQEKQFKIKEVK